MRIVAYLLLVSGCAALPVGSVSLALMSVVKTDNPTDDGRIPGATRFLATGDARITMAEVEALADMLGESLPIALVAGEKTDLLLYDGRVLKAACIVALTETDVTVAHAEGLTDVEIERVPADVVERARAEMAAIAAESRRIDAEVAARDAERIRERETRRTAELEERFPVARTEQSAPAQRQATTPAQLLLALQERFPPRKKGRNQLGIEFDLPPRQVWSFYNSYFLASNLAYLPETLAIMEARLSQDITAWEWRSKSTSSLSQSVEHVRAEQTLAWLSGTLRGYLQEARQLTRGR